MRRWVEDGKTNIKLCFKLRELLHLDDQWNWSENKLKLNINMHVY